MISAPTPPSSPPDPTCTLAFIGGGNMARAMIGGLIQSGTPAHRIQVVEPNAATGEALQQRFGIALRPEADASLRAAHTVVWAVKPQVMREAALASAPHTQSALHLSVAAGIRSSSLARWLGTERIVRAMPNTPALIGEGIAGLCARTSVSAADRAEVERILQPTGACVWVPHEGQLDAVTALSGSGPAYVFYLLEALMAAGEKMGLEAGASRQLALATVRGAALLACQGDEPPQVLRERVTSKGGTTHAALQVLQERGVRQHVIDALLAAQARATELGDEFGRAA